MVRIKAIVIVSALLSGCASGYNPQNAYSVQDIARNNRPDSLNCPVGSTVYCDIEGGGIVGKTYSNCRCSW